MKNNWIYKNNETIKKLDTKLKSLNPKKDNKLILEINEMIRNEYHRSLKTAVINRLQEVIDLIDKDDYETLDNLIDYDMPYGYASYISFSDIINGNYSDIGEVINELENSKPLK